MLATLFAEPWGAPRNGGNYFMKRFVRGAIAVVCLVVVSACASLVTGGPLIRPGEPVGAIEVINRSARLVDVVLISDCSASTYGLNRLPDGVAIPPGRSYRFQVSAGCWDVDAGVVGYGEARQRMNVAPNSIVQYSVAG